MRIVIGQLSHETNTFSSVLTNEELFKSWEWAEGNDLVQRNREVKDYLGGMIVQSEELGIEIIPTFSASALPSGLIPIETYQSIKDIFIKNFPQKGQYDGVCLALHGAGVVEKVDDLEGDFLEFIRGIVGKEIPIVVTLDLHGNITEKMLNNADLLLGVKLYPHTDSYDRGKEAVIRLKQIIEKEIQPKMHLESLPLVIPTFTSNLYPMKDINKICWEYEKQQGVLDCSLFHGFPYTDVPFAGVSIVVATDGDKQHASSVAKSVASTVWDVKNDFFFPLVSPAEGIKKALAIPSSPIVLNETSDNPGSGTPGDGTYLLKAMLEANLENACIGMIYDPEVVELAHKQGVGTEIETFIGGKTDHFHGDSVFIKGYVKSLSDGIFKQTSPMWQGREVNLKKSARIQVGGLDIIVGCISNQVFDEQVFLIHGIDVFKRKIVGIKSSQHFRAAYESIATEIITVDSPGLSTLQLDQFDYQKLRRPIYPLDKEIQLDSTEQNNDATIKNV
ncbi:M81 family metallopeptidase [Ureibacillus sp. NPDC094379]